MAEHDVQAIRGLLARYSAGDQGVIADLVAPTYFTHVPGPGEPTATETWERFAAVFRAAAPDLAIDIPDLAPGAGGHLRGTAVVSGTQTGPLWGVPPTGRRHAFEIPVTLRPAEGGWAVNVELAVPEALAILRSLDMVNPPDQMHLPNKHPVVLDDFLLKVLFTGQVADRPCSHLDDARVTRPAIDRCVDCGPGDVWPALRMCLTCGHVGCCDTSVHRHAARHWEESGHPLMRSIRMDEGWIWCYEDDAMFQRRTLERIEARLSGPG